MNYLSLRFTFKQSFLLPSGHGNSKTVNNTNWSSRYHRIIPEMGNLLWWLMAWPPAITVQKSKFFCIEDTEAATSCYLPTNKIHKSQKERCLYLPAFVPFSCWRWQQLPCNWELPLEFHHSVKYYAESWTALAAIPRKSSVRLHILQHNTIVFLLSVSIFLQKQIPLSTTTATILFVRIVWKHMTIVTKRCICKTSAAQTTNTVVCWFIS